MQCAQNFRQRLQVVVIRGGLRLRLPRILRRLPPILRGRAASFSGGRRRQRRASNIRGSKKEKNACADRYRQQAANSAMAPERNLIGNSGHNCRIYNRAASATRLKEKCSNGLRANNIQWFSHGMFLLLPHLLQHRAVYLLRVPRMASWAEN